MTTPGRRLLALAAVLAIALAAVIAWVLVNHDQPLAWDQAVHDAALGHRTAGLTAVAVAVSRTSEYIAYVLAAVAGALALRGRHWAVGGIVGILALAAGQGIRVGLAALIGRDRPPESEWAMHAAGYSMPSGHTATATLAAGLICLALAGTVARVWVVAGIVLGAVWALADGAGRIYVGVHWPTDVLAGWLLGGLLTVVAALLLSGVRRRESAIDRDDGGADTSDPGQPEERETAGRR